MELERSRDEREVHLSDLDGIKAALKYIIEKDMYSDIHSATLRIRNEHLYTKGQEDEVISNIKENYKNILEGLE